MTAGLANAAFIISYVFYTLQFLKGNGGALVYPVYLAPAVVYALMGVSAAGLKKICGGRVMERLRELSPSLFAFILLFASAIAERVNFPDPHNFFTRKMEIILGASYIIFIAALTFIFLRRAAGSFRSWSKEQKKIPAMIFIFYLVFYLSVSMWFNYANEPTGDEPAFLLRAHSIVFDRDLDLKNNFANQDYKRFYHRELMPQQQDIVRDGKIFSYHPALYSFFIAPFYLLGGRLGASISTNILSALLIAFIFYLLTMTGTGKGPALICSMLAGFTIPLFEYTNIIATEIPAALLTVAAYLLLKGGKRSAIWFSTAVAGLVWLHLRNLPIAASLGIIYLYDNRKDLKQAMLFIGAMVLAAAALLAFNYFNYGVLFASYSSGNSGSLGSNFKLHNITGTLVMFLDRQLGLLPFSPVFCVIFAGAAMLFKDNRRVFWDTMIILIPYYLMITSWHDWGIGNAGPRYFMPIIYMLPLLLAPVVSRLKTPLQKDIFNVLTGLSLFMSLIIACVPWFRWDKHPYESWIVELAGRFGHVNLKAVLPNYRIEGAAPLYLTLFWIAVIAFVNYLYLAREKGVKK